MSALIQLARKSLWNRRGTVILTMVAIALSVALFLGIEKLRKGVRDGFEQTISGTHLIVGAPSGSLNLLLYSVFRMGGATAEISWTGYKRLAAREDIEWAVPISLGDSHRGFRVMGTTPDYFDRYQYAGAQNLRLAEGARFDELFDVVIGADVSRALRYKIGDTITLNHGLGKASLDGGHDNRPFTIKGILAPTGTPVDKTLHISLEAMTALHVGWETGAKNPLADTISTDQIRQFNLTPKTVTAVYVGLKRKGTILTTRRAINTDKREPMMAIIPGEALKELWSVTTLAERALLAVSGFVILVGLVSILVALLTSLNERRREMSILRATGARPHHIFSLLLLEAGTIGACGAALGIGLVHGLLLFAQPVLASRFGVVIGAAGVDQVDGITFLAVTFAALLMALGPAMIALRRSLADGLSIRV
jgi:putative ABC transport system permease protein